MAQSTPGTGTDNSGHLVQNPREGHFRPAFEPDARMLALRSGTVTALGTILMRLKRFLLVGLLVICIAAAAVLLFLAGDHDEEYRNNAPAAPARASSAY
jgi:hypothetical protein